MKRSTVWQSVQVGVETVAGTPVAANVRLLNTYIDPQPVTAINVYRPAGGKFVTVRQRGKEFTRASVSGPIAYAEMPYLLRTLLVAGTDGTYKPAPFAASTPDSLTVEVGSSTKCERFAYGVCTSLSFRFTKEEASFSGEMIGRTMTEAHTITPTPTNVGTQVVNPDVVEVYLGDTVAGLAKVTGIDSAEVRIQGRWSPFFGFDSAQTSYADLVELAPEITAEFVIPHESVASGYMADLRGNSTKFFRIKATESIGSTCLFQITCPFVFVENERGDVDDLYASTFRLRAVYDSTFAGAIEVVSTTS